MVDAAQTVRYLNQAARQALGIDQLRAGMSLEPLLQSRGLRATPLPAALPELQVLRLEAPPQPGNLGKKR